MEEITVIEVPTEKIYKDNAMWVATFLGGPLAGGYVMAQNFKAFNEPGKAVTTWICTVIATIVIFGAIFSIPNSAKIPGQLIPIFYTVIMASLMKHFQGASITAHINAGGQTYNWGRVIVVGLLGLLSTFAIIAIIIIALGSTIYG